jgi:murein DD-endopeptidase MepM/ murein hydrolase activator NlpD
MTAGPGRRAVVALVAVLVATTLGPTAGAETTPTTSDPRGRQRQIDAQIQELRDQVSEASAQENQLLTALGETRGRLASIEAAIADLDVRIVDAGIRLTAAQQVVADLDLRITGVEDRLAATEAEHAEVADRRADAIVELYMGGAPDALSGLANLVLDGDEAVDVLRAQEYLEGRTLDATSYTDQLRAIEGDLDDLHAELTTHRAAADAGRAQVEADQAELGRLRGEQQALAESARAEEAGELALVADARGRQDEFEDEIESLEAESAQIEAYLRSLQTRAAGSGAAESGGGQFQRPVPGVITSSFGWRVHPVLGTRRLHAGTDFRGASGDPIRAAEAGTVVLAGVKGGYGNCVIIDHGDGLATLYAHQSQILVSEGEQVERGEVIGRVGSTGMSTGPHLHFEVRQYGTPVDAVPYI